MIEPALVPPAAFWEPDWCSGSPRAEHVPLIFSVVDLLRPRCAVQIGLGGGDLYAALCQAVDRLGLGTSVLCLDAVYDMPAPDSGSAQFQRIHDAKYRSFSRLLRLDQVSGLDEVPDGSVDLLHLPVDAVCGFDSDVLRGWLARLSASSALVVTGSGALSGGDTPPWWRELQQRPGKFQLFHGGGATLWAIGPDHPPGLARFLEAASTPADAAKLRAAFARLGAGLVDGVARSDAAAEVERIELALTRTASEADLLRLKLDETHVALALRDRDVASRSEALAQAHRRVAELGACFPPPPPRSGALQAKLAELEAGLAAEAARSGALQARLAELEAGVSAEAARSGALRTRLAELEAKLAAEVGRNRLLAGRVDELKAGARDAERLKEEASRRREGLEEEVARVEAALAASKANAAWLGDELQALREQARRDEEAWAFSAGVSRAEKARLTAELQAIRQSTMWRMLGPLRRVFGRTPRVARLSRRAVKLAYWTATLQLPQRVAAWRRRADHEAASAPHVAEPPQPPPPAALPAPAGSAVEPSPPPAFPSPVVPPPVAVAPAPAAPDVEPGRVVALEYRVLTVESLLDAERHRVDQALARLEGVYDEIDAFHAARATAEYQRAFDAPEPLVSVCVATVNRPDLLIERCLRSLREQSYRNLQIVVVGDHCTDDTGYRIARLGDSRISFVNLPVRGPYPEPGPDRWRVAGSNAMNHALILAEGAFVMHLDDDDAATHDRVATMVAAAQSSRADFCWHALWYEGQDGVWSVIGNGKLTLGQVSTGSVFYHRYLARFGWDVRAYRLNEPGDWNRVRRIKALRPRTHWVDRPLVYHYAEQSQPKFVRQDAETFLE